MEERRGEEEGRRGNGRREKEEGCWREGLKGRVIHNTKNGRTMN